MNLEFPHKAGQTMTNAYHIVGVLSCSIPTLFNPHIIVGLSIFAETFLVAKSQLCWVVIQSAACDALIPIVDAQIHVGDS
jgi:hypothetical protein